MNRLVFVIVLLLGGCASRQLEKTAVISGANAVGKDIRLLYEVKDEFSTEYFGMAGFVIENNTNLWLTVDSIEITSDSLQRSNLSIIGGNDIGTWFTSMSKAKQIESQNRQRLWGTISLVSGLGAVASKDEQVKKFSALTAVTGAAMLTLEQFNALKDRISMLDYFPEDHLLRTPFRVPPGLGVDKWMVINSQVADPDILVSTLKMKMYYNGKGTREYDLELIKLPKKMLYSLNWQNRLIISKYSTPRR